MGKMTEKFLIVVAHPDDETLGMGGTIYKLSKQNEIYVMIITDGVTARYPNKKAIKKQEQDAIKATKFLGAKKVIFCGLLDQKLDVIPIKDIVSHISRAIKEINPSTIYTHFEGDINQDHRRVFEAVNIAARPTSNCKVSEILCFETPTSTEWGVKGFFPNVFKEISEEDLNKKIKAFSFYEKEQKDSLSPRSSESLKALAKYRGTSVGMNLAEAFILIRKRELPSSPSAINY